MIVKKVTCYEFWNVLIVKFHFKVVTQIRYIRIRYILKLIEWGPLSCGVCSFRMKKSMVDLLEENDTLDVSRAANELNS